MAAVVVEMSGDEAKLYRSYQRVIDQANKLNGAIKETKKSSEESFGQSAIGQLAGYASQFMGIAGAVTAAAAAMRAMREESDRLGQGQRTGGPALGQLAQLANNPAEMSRLVTAAKATLAEGGARNMEEAARLQFSLESAGAGSFRGDFSRMQATGLVPNASVMAESASKIRRAFGESKTGSFRDIASAAFGASAKGLGSVEEIQSASAVAAGTTSRVGLSMEETMAAVATVASALGPEEAGTAVRQLGKSLEVNAIKKKYVKPNQDLAGMLSDLQAREKAGKSIYEMLGGRVEAVSAYGLLTNEAGASFYPSTLADAINARRSDATGAKLGLATGVSENRAAMAATIAENRTTLGGTNQGIRENLADALQADMVEKYRQRYGDFGAAAAPMAISAHRFFSGNQDFLQDYQSWGSPGTQSAITELLSSIEKNTRDQSRGARSQSAANQQPE